MRLLNRQYRARYDGSRNNGLFQASNANWALPIKSRYGHLILPMVACPLVSRQLAACYASVTLHSASLGLEGDGRPDKSSAFCKQQARQLNRFRFMYPSRSSPIYMSVKIEEMTPIHFFVGQKGGRRAWIFFPLSGFGCDGHGYQGNMTRRRFRSS